MITSAQLLGFLLAAVLITATPGPDIGDWLKRTPRAGAWLDRIAGAVFVGLGVRLLVVCRRARDRRPRTGHSPMRRPPPARSSD